MKTQIRRGVFETNSSSVHTISVVKELPEDFKYPKELVFGKGPDVISEFRQKYYKPGDAEYKEDKYSDPVQQRADVVFYHITSKSLLGYIKTKELITEQLASIGVKAIFNEDYKHLVKYELCSRVYDYEDDEFEDMYSDLIEGELYNTTWKEKEDGTIEKITTKLTSKTPFLVNFIFGSNSFSDTWEDNYSHGPEIPEGCYEFSKRNG